MCNATLGACIFQQTKIAKTSTVWQESAWVFPAGVLVTRAGEITHRHRCAERRPRRWGVRGSIRRRRSRARTCWSRRIGRRSLVRCGDGVHAHALSLSLSLSLSLTANELKRGNQSSSSSFGPEAVTCCCHENISARFAIGRLFGSLRGLI